MGIIKKSNITGEKNNSAINAPLQGFGFFLSNHSQHWANYCSLKALAHQCPLPWLVILHRCFASALGSYVKSWKAKLGSKCTPKGTQKWCYRSQRSNAHFSLQCFLKFWKVSKPAKNKSIITPVWEQCNRIQFI